MRLLALWLGLGSCFGDFCSLSYFFSGLFRLLGWVLGAVLGISAVSATFSRLFSGFWAGFGSCFRDFCCFSYFFSAFSRLLGWIWELFWGFLQFQLLFPGFSQAFRMDLGAVLEILGISATQDLPAMLSTYGYCTL